LPFVLRLLLKWNSLVGCMLIWMTTKCYFLCIFPLCFFFFVYFTVQCRFTCASVGGVRYNVDVLMMMMDVWLFWSKTICARNMTMGNGCCFGLRDGIGNCMNLFNAITHIFIKRKWSDEEKDGKRPWNKN